jgi:hypothetical protein
MDIEPNSYLVARVRPLKRKVQQIEFKRLLFTRNIKMGNAVFRVSRWKPTKQNLHSEFKRAIDPSTEI